MSASGLRALASAAREGSAVAVLRKLLDAMRAEGGVGVWEGEVVYSLDVVRAMELGRAVLRLEDEALNASAEETQR